MKNKIVEVTFLSSSKCSNHGWRTVQCVYTEDIVEGNIFRYPCEVGYAMICSFCWVMPEKGYQRCYLTYRTMSHYEYTLWARDNE